MAELLLDEWVVLKKLSLGEELYQHIGLWVWYLTPSITTVADSTVASLMRKGYITSIGDITEQGKELAG